MKHDAYYSATPCSTRYEYLWNIIFQCCTMLLYMALFCQQVQTNRSIKQKQYTKIMNLISKALL